MIAKAKTIGTLLALALLGWTGHAECASIDTGTLRVEIVDRSTGQVVPAMVCITSLTDHKWRVPPDGRQVPPFTTVQNFYEDPKSWTPGDIGPVRVTNGEYNDNETRSFVYNGKSSYPFWQEPAAYFVSKPFSILLPVGKWRIAAARGIEYSPVFQEFTVRPDENRHLKIILQRWVDMARQGWYSGDDHVHVRRCKPSTSEFLLTWARAEDVHVANILHQTVEGKRTFEQMGYGKDFRYQQGDYVLVSGQEDPSTEIHEQGHAIALNIQEPVLDTSRMHLYDFVFDRVHAQGGLVGYAHMAWALEYYRRTRPETYATWDATINVIRGKVDFLEILQFRNLGVEDFYDFLSLGQKLTASAGSDVPWGNTIGEVRMYVYTGRNFSADAWFSAMHSGHTFVTNGPMLILTVDRAIPGDEVKVSKNRKVRIHARAWAPVSIGAPQLLEVVAQGRVIRSATSHKPNQTELTLDFEIPAEASQWIAARVTSQNGGIAHTSPVYLIVDGKSFRAEHELPRLVEKRLKILDFIGGRLHDPEYTATYGKGEVDALAVELEDARRHYQNLLPALATGH